MSEDNVELSLFPKQRANPKPARVGADAEIVWAAYLSHHPRAIFDPVRQRLIERRLDEGFPPALLVDAINGNHRDEHARGNNDRGRKYHHLDLILRDADRIEAYATLEQEAREKRIRAERRRVQIEKSLAEEEAEEQELVPPPADLTERLKRSGTA